MNSGAQTLNILAELLSASVEFPHRIVLSSNPACDWLTTSYQRFALDSMDAQVFDDGNAAHEAEDPAKTVMKSPHTLTVTALDRSYMGDTHVPVSTLPSWEHFNTAVDA